MRGTITIAGSMFVFFTILFVLAVGLGAFNPAAVGEFLQGSGEAGNSRALIFGLIVLLLAIDLFLPVPSTIIMILAGFTLGPVLGPTASSLGAMAAGIGGYAGCRAGGRRIYRRLVDEEEEARFSRLFEEWGALAFVVSRAFPMAPEVLACVAGMSRMPFGRFAARFAYGTIPFAIICGVAGSLSTWENPWPAIAAAIAIPASAFIAWKFIGARRLGAAASGEPA